MFSYGARLYLFDITIHKTAAMYAFFSAAVVSPLDNSVSDVEVFTRGHHIPFFPHFQLVFRTSSRLRNLCIHSSPALGLQIGHSICDTERTQQAERD
jgi:hypothetical protein